MVSGCVCGPGRVAPSSLRVGVRAAPSFPLDPTAPRRPNVLPLANRMRLGQDFDTAVRRGRRAGRRTLVVHAAVTSAEAGQSLGEQKPVLVGLVVSRAVGSAVVRNRVKRRLRAAMRPRVAHLPPGALVVLRANPAAGGASMADLTADLDAALTRALQQATSADRRERVR